MANNRLLLCCVRCAASIPIARLQVGMEDEWLPSRVSSDEYVEWLAQHSHCDPDVPGLHVRLEGENSQALTLAPQP